MKHLTFVRAGDAGLREAALQLIHRDLSILRKETDTNKHQHNNHSTGRVTILTDLYFSLLKALLKNSTNIC